MGDAPGMSVPTVAVPSQTGQPPGQTPPAPPQDPQVAARLAAISRREVEATRKIREASTIEQRLKAQEEAVKAREAKVAEFDRMWTENPLKAMESRGTDYNVLTKMMLNNGEATPEHKIQQLSSKIQALEAMLQERDSNTEKEKQAQAAAGASEAEKNYRAILAANLKRDSEKYPLTALYSRDDLVYSTMDAHYNKTAPKDDSGRPTGPGEILSEEKAFQLVEDYLQAEAKKALPILQKTGLAPPPAATQDSRFGSRTQEPAQVWHERQPKTLTNDLPTSLPSAPKRFLSDEERMDNAYAKMRAARGR